jgi:hypothetical protein
LRLLRDLYPDLLAETVARELGRPVRSIYLKARGLGLRKSADFLTSDRSRRIQRGKHSPAMVASRFQSGMTPWNKGMKGLNHEGSKATQFKKGEMRGAAQHNYVPIGTLRVSKDGYLERKYTDDPTLAPTRRWVAVHRQVWEQTHGAIPITPDRLECISRAENARRNHPRSKSPELAKLVQLKGAITRQVNRIAREAQEQNQ